MRTQLWLLVCALAAAAAVAAESGAVAEGSGAGASAVSHTWTLAGQQGASLDVKTDGGAPRQAVHKEDVVRIVDEEAEGEHEKGLLIDIEDHTSITIGGVCWAAFMIISLVFAHLLHHYHVTWLPESVVLIAIGGLLGFVLKMLYGPHHLQEYFGAINVLAINILLLPPIIFESGWALRRQDFLSQLEYILVFAVIGTGISTIVVCSLLLYSGFLDSWRVAFSFASLISATDPVATLATYSTLQVEPLLNVMVFGESVINDAVAIVFFKAGNNLQFGKSPSTATLAIDMLTLLLGSPLLGSAIGMMLVTTIFTAGMEESQNLTGLVCCTTPWLIYGFAELCGVSGIIATLFCGIVMERFLRPKLTKPARDHVGMMLRHQACIADMAVFILVGVFMVLLTKTHDIGFSCAVCGFCLVGRTAAVFPCGLFVNWLKKCRGRQPNANPDNMHVLESKHLVMMWHAGLRGGIAMALALELNPESMDMDTMEKLQEATFFVICSFLLVFGGTTQFMLEHLGIQLGVDMPEDALCKHRYTDRHTSLVYSAAQRWNRQPSMRQLQLPRPQAGLEMQAVSGLRRVSEAEEGAGSAGRGSTTVEGTSNRRSSAEEGLSNQRPSTEGGK